MTKSVKMLALSIIFILYSAIQCTAGRSVVDTSLMLSHATAKLDSICQLNVQDVIHQWKIGIIQGDSSEMGEFFSYHGLGIKDFIYLNTNGKSYGALLLGCVGNGEFILLDSANPEIEISRIEMNLPDMHARFGEFRDINNDNTPELEIFCSSGSRRIYLCLLSIYEDSLKFIKDVQGRYQFSASDGNIQVEDVDSDGIYEITTHHYSKDGRSYEPVIYKWNGSVFIEKKQIKDIEKQD